MAATKLVITPLLRVYALWLDKRLVRSVLSLADCRCRQAGKVAWWGQLAVLTLSPPADGSACPVHDADRRALQRPEPEGGR